MPRGRIARNPVERLLDLVEQQGDCWVWQGYIRPDGYGSFRVQRGTKLAHRASYEMFVGPVPEDLELDHLCRVRACVYPSHLEPVTKSVNQQRGANGMVTHCHSGHPFDEANTYRTSHGQRSCRACNRAAVNRYASRMKGVAK